MCNNSKDYKKANGLCVNDSCKDSNFQCLYWKLQLPQKKCWLKTLQLGVDVPCEVLNYVDWFIKNFFRK